MKLIKGGQGPVWSVAPLIIITIYSVFHCWHFGVLGVDGRINIKMEQKYLVKVWAELNWHSTGYCV
jgi:hypothetical protein